MIITNNKNPLSFRENIYNVIVQALDYSGYEKERKTQKQIRHWIDEELQRVSQETV